ncbi:hypothetical protein EDWATA_03712 [Edwardsiella tarda ATCC 23685]|uniref:Uncharacterized protein n=1 Tax=Edwardsiella tarda ATCC 23685 TaxID=500638 RepID=D4FA94_EDWTA|nr:hypothetical protein EDWATA_03712 [Edwardsiella tarda ATCC 23685]
MLTEIIIKKTKIQRNPFCGKFFYFDNTCQDQLLLYYGFPAGHRHD